MNLTSPDAILAESFRIIEAEVGAHAFDALEWQVVRRMIHACGDVELARAVCFQQDAVRAGINALRRGTPIVTDGRMTLSGINRAALQALHIEVHCFIDDAGVKRQAEETGRTRSACAMEKALAEIGPAIYVVGNAPTALATIAAAVREGRIKPALLLALPVGFVGVLESKQQALALDVPLIAVRGRKGGSAIAAAAVNALLILAREEQP